MGAMTGVMGAVAGAFTSESRERAANRNSRLVNGLASIARLARRWRVSTARPARLAVIERVALGPRQSLMLVEAEGVHLLVATSADGAPAFYPLPSSPVTSQGLKSAQTSRKLQGRISW
jgi:flagellar biogenesis protein FliO